MRALALSLLGVGGCSSVDRVFCANDSCGWSEEESTRIAALAGLAETPPADTSNKYAGIPAAEQLGRLFFSDPRFSGVASGNDDIGRPMPYGRAAKGQPLNMSCYSCHDLRQGGADTSTLPGNVSLGANWTNTNTPTVFNTAFLPLLMWAARIDSLWSQPIGVVESVMGSNRARAAWIIASFYRADYTAVFPEYPLPMSGTIAEVLPTLATDGQCRQDPDCPATCRLVRDDASGASRCWPRFPLDAKPGKKAGCQPGDAGEPFGDALDCMAPEDQTALKRVVVNFAKAIAAFEYRLVSRNSAFDQFATDLRGGRANESGHLSVQAKNGARLFVGKAGCADCHNTPLLSDGNVYNIGVADVGAAVASVDDCPKGGVCDCVTPNNCLPWGARDGIVKLSKNAYLRTSEWSDNPADDSRKPYLERDPESIPKGSYRTPSLRDVALTAPYMHNGSLPSLEAVVAHYNRGGNPEALGDRSARIKPLNLSEREQNDLVAFLKSLSGEPLPAELADPPELPR
ncbi:MAG: cytochrome c peroxidase [Pseudomonadota bacterium]